MNKNNLFIITGTTRGLGNALKNKLEGNIILSINRKKNKEFGICLDLSTNSINLNEFTKIILDYEKIFFISNASTIKPIKKIKDLTSDDLDISINTNFVNQAKIILQIAKSHKKYSIINITSGAVFTSNSELSLYSSSKAAMHRFIEILKKEEENNPNALYIDNFDPGRMQTQMQKDLINAKNLSINIKKLVTVEEIAENIFKILGKYIND